MKYTLGIDTGLAGAMALIDNELTIHQLIDNPILYVDKGKKVIREYDVTAIKKIFDSLDRENTYVVIEKTYPRPTKFGGSAASNWFLGAGFMMFVGMLVYGGFRYQIVDPRTWQPSMFDGLGKGDSKMLSFQVASRLFPTAPLQTAKGKIIDGKGDALCIAEWGRRKLLGITA